MSYPRKTKSNLVGTRGEREFIASLPDTWGYLKHDSDYGIDFMLELWSQDEPPKLITRDVAVQIKSHLNFPDVSPSKNLPRSKRNLARGWWHERIKLSTLRYLAKSNAFLFSIYCDERRIPWAFDDFFGILPGDLKRGATRMWDETMVCICPIRPIASDALKTFAGQEYVNIPVHPFNFSGFLPSATQEKQPKESNRRRFPEDFDFDLGLSRASKVIGHRNWREVLLDSALSDIFDAVYRVRMAPFFQSEPASFIATTAQEIVRRNVEDIADAWILFECLIAGFFTKIYDDSWLHDVIRFRSQFFSLLALRLMRNKAFTLSPELFAEYCDVGIIFPTGAPRLHAFQYDPFDCYESPYSISEYYNEACGYLVDLIETDFPLARRTISWILVKAAKAEQYGLNGLFGAMVEGWRPTKLVPLVAEIVAQDFNSGWEQSDNETTNAIRALGSLGVSCAVLEPSEK